MIYPGLCLSCSQFVLQSFGTTFVGWRFAFGFVGGSLSFCDFLFKGIVARLVASGNVNLSMGISWIFCFRNISITLVNWLCIIGICRNWINWICKFELFVDFWLSFEFGIERIEFDVSEGKLNSLELRQKALLRLFACNS